MNDIYLYGTFADKNYRDGNSYITLESFQNDLKSVKGKYDVHIDSMGGLVDTGAAIFELLDADENYNNCFIDGCCASIATLIPCANHAGKTYVHEDDVFMIHEVKVVLPAEQAISHHQLTELSTDVRDSTRAIAEIYADTTGKTVQDLLDLMEAETWLEGGQEIIDFGFADELLEEEKSLTANAKALRKVASVEYAKAHYKHVPKSLLTLNKSSEIHDTEQTKEVMEGMDEEKKTTSTDAPTPDEKQGEEQKKITSVEELIKAYPELVEKLKKQIIEELEKAGEREEETEGKASEEGDAKPDDKDAESDDEKVEEAVKEALAKERNRLKEIDEIAWAVDEKTLNKAKYDEPISAKDLFFMVAKKDEKLKRAFTNGEKADFRNSGAENVETLPADTAMVNHELTEDERLLSLNEKINKLYKEARK